MYTIIHQQKTLTITLTHNPNLNLTLILDVIKLNLKITAQMLRLIRTVPESAHRPISP